MNKIDERFSLENQRINIFIASSSEAKKIAYGIKSYFPDELFLVKVWDKAFKVGKSNLENLKEITVIYDYAIIVLTKDDFIIHREYQDGGVPPNIMFEAGLFYGRIGENRTFFVAEDSIHEFVDKVFSDFKGISLEKTFSKKLHPESKPEEIVGEVAVTLKKKITDHFLHSAEIGFLPSAALAIGYFENFVARVIEALYALRNDKDEDILELTLKVKKEDKNIKIPFFKQTFKLKVVIPQNLLDTSHDTLKGKLVDNDLDNTTIITKSRKFGIFWKEQTLEEVENDGFIFYDFPTTLFSSKKVIDMALTSGTAMNLQNNEVKRLVGEKEIFNFIKALKYKIDSSEKSYIKNYVEIIANSEILS